MAIELPVREIELPVRYDKVQTVETEPETNDNEDANFRNDTNLRNDANYLRCCLGMIEIRSGDAILLALFASLLLSSVLTVLVLNSRVVQMVEDDNYNGPSSSSLQFVHIPRNGGTYVENLASLQDPPLFYGPQREKQQEGVIHRPWKNSSEIEICDTEIHNDDGCCSWWNVPPRMFDDFDSNNVKLFAILRDPIERAISEVKWENSLEPHGGDYLTNKELSSRLRISIRGDRTTHNCHFLEQYLYITDAQDKLLPNVEILCFERLDADLRKRFPKWTFPNKNNDTIDRNESYEQQDVVLMPDVMDKLGEVYARDFELHEQFCVRERKNEF